MSHWNENWATIPDTASGKENGRTHGVCVCNDGTVKVFHQAENGLLTFDPDGKLISAVGGDRWRGAHGLSWMEEGGVEFLWLVDQDSAEVAKVTLEGETVQVLPRPEHPVYKEQNYVPTWATQNPENGDVWVGDGYGASLVHRFSKDGELLQSLEGTEAGAFNSPHGLRFRTKADGKLELYVTDRGNQRIKVLDAEGMLLRVSDSCHSPCGFDFFGDTVLVPELFTGVKILDADTLECLEEHGVSDRVGPNEQGTFWPPKMPEGWPDVAGTEHIQPGMLSSPHAACFDREGNLFVVEWIIGGRITKIER